MSRLPPTPLRFASKRFGRARYWLTVHWHAWGRIVRYAWPELVGFTIVAVIAVAMLVRIR